jgi:hypothetical protein
MSDPTRHVFTPPADEPWARCVICKLAESAHHTTGQILPTAESYRCPECVWAAEYGHPPVHLEACR